jgi:uncharacterized protein (DUF1786 family)
MTEDWVSRAARERLKKAVDSIEEAAYTLADNLDREVSLNEMIAAALRETINQCQNGQGVIYSHDIYAMANELEAHD